MAQAPSAETPPTAAAEMPPDAAAPPPPEDEKPALPELMRVKVHRLRHEAEDIRGIELVSESGAPLPAFKAGAHVDVEVILPGKVRARRSYSIASPPGENPFVYHLAVKWEEHSTGGSVFLHENVRLGYVIEITPPKNFFELRPDAEHSILIAGGVGIAPILAMAYELDAESMSFEIHYTGHTRERMAFRPQVEGFTGKSTMYVGRDPNKGGLNLRAIMSRPKPGTHVYACGPTSMIEEVHALGHEYKWPDGAVHSEVFKKPEPRPGDGPVEVVIKSSGQTIQVPKDMSILDAMLAAGVESDYDCKIGTCGTCSVQVLEGMPDHRDNVLLEAERKANRMCTCVSRSETPRLVLDL
ncbi:MAG: oxidoreductase [Alphaproteobacteria bacterium]|nr:oxidoreductase [Alphaproteobacteria bacterium]